MTRPLAGLLVLICPLFTNSRHRYKRANSKVGVDDDDGRKVPQDAGPSVTTALTHLNDNEGAARDEHCGASSICKTQDNPNLSVLIA